VGISSHTFVVRDLFESKTCVMDIVNINVNMGMLWANPKTVVLLYVRADCNVTKGLLHVDCLQKAH
jgi:hypothetical protein